MRINILIITFLISVTLLVANTKTQEITGKYLTIGPDGSVSGNFKFITSERGNEINFQSLFGNSKSEVTFDNNMNFKTYTEKYHDTADLKLVELIGRDYTHAELSKNGKEINFNSELNGKKLKREKVKIKGNFKIFNNLFLTLQKDLQNGAKDFESFLIFPESASGYKASFDFYKSQNLLTKTPGYKNAPKFFVVGSKFEKEVIVCEVGLMGIAGKFFPHKFSFVFENGGYYDFLGYWGGNPETPNYYIADKNTGEK